jgi:dTDP-4-amino-4,6-dideoxygalactose transaminase
MKPVTWGDFPLPLIQVNPPSLRLSNKNIKRAYRSGIFSNSGELQKDASNLLAKNVNDSLSGYLASSNTAALVACLMAIGVRGKHVVISNFTFAATFHAVVMAGGIPVLCDINTKDFELDRDSVQRLLNMDRLDIAAVVPTRVFGYVRDLSDLIEMCEKDDVPVVVDSAAAFPFNTSSWNFPNLATYEVFSLHATKVFGIGEGGLVVGSQKAIEKVRMRANFGIDASSYKSFTDGLNSKADEFTAARALARFDFYKADIEKRRNFCDIYRRLVDQFDSLTTLEEDNNTIFTYFPLVFETEKLLGSFQTVISDFVITRRYYFPTINSGYCGSVKFETPVKLEISESISRRILCLPVYVNYRRGLPEHLYRKMEDIMRSIS